MIRSTNVTNVIVLKRRLFASVDIVKRLLKKHNERNILNAFKYFTNTDKNELIGRKRCGIQCKVSQKVLNP